MPFVAFLLTLGLAGNPIESNLSAQQPETKLVLKKPTPKVEVKEEVREEPRKPVRGHHLELIVPETVAPYKNAELVVKTHAKFVTLKAQATLFETVKVYELIPNNDDEHLYVFTGKPAKFLVTVTTFDPETGIKEDSKVVTIGKPEPTPDPDPDPNPDPDPDPNPDPNPPPVPIPGVARVLIVEETKGDTSAAYRPYLNVLNSNEIQDYLNKKVPGKWRKWDDDYTQENLKNQEQVWKDVYFNKDNKYPRTSPNDTSIIPWIYITNGTKGYSGPLPNNIHDTLELLKKYLGE